jgi:hypothetical protein
MLKKGWDEGKWFGRLVVQGKNKWTDLG